MSAIATAIVGGAVVGGIASNMAAGKSADAISGASASATAEQQREFDILQQAQAPYQQIGKSALNQLATLYGLPTYQDPSTQNSAVPGYDPSSGYAIGAGGGIRQLLPSPTSSVPYNPLFSRPGAISGITQRRIPEQGGVTIDHATGQVIGGNQLAPSAPDYSGFWKSPDYNFAMTEGLNAVQNSAAARGGLFSGNAGRGIASFASGLATQNYNNYVNRLAALAGIGQSAANNVGSGALSTGQGIASNLLAAGNARASGIQNAYAGINNSIQGGLSNYLFMRAYPNAFSPGVGTDVGMYPGE